MENKLELLKQKEEELRKINEQLDMKNDKLLTGAMAQLRKDAKPEESEKDDEVEDSMAGIKGQLLKPPSDDEDDFDNYENDGFEESKAVDTNNVGRSMEGLDGVTSAAYSQLKGRYEDSQEQVRDQDKTINF